MRNNGQINDFTDNKKKLLSIHIFSIIKGILFFPYIITFFPFILLILLPGICFKKYYFKIFTFYVSIILAGGLDIKRKYSYYLWKINYKLVKYNKNYSYTHFLFDKIFFPEKYSK